MMSGRFKSEDREASPDYSGDSTPSAADNKTANSPPKKSRKAMQKKVVSIPIKDLDSSRTKGESAPPTDSWAWRKYGQKPIKGSPYPRGYYRCSSSKGCPARKQVERSRVDPNMLVITYSADHNHPWPPSSRTHHSHRHVSHHSPPSSSAAAVAYGGDPSAATSDVRISTEEKESNNFGIDFHGWFGDMGAATTMLESSSVLGSSFADDVAMLLPIMGDEEEEESLFAGLGELPECSAVFRRREVMPAAAAWCGTTTTL